MKKLLWVAKESFTGLVHGTIKHFDDYENEVIFVHPTESLLLDPSYVNFRTAHPNIRIHDLNVIAKNFVKKESELVVDELQYYLKKYQGFFGINELRLSSQVFTTQYHNRNYFRDISELDKDTWILLLFKYFEELLDTSKPDFIFDFDNSEISRSVLWLVSNVKGIPYICLEHARYKGYIIPNFSLGRRNDNILFDSYYRSNLETKYANQVHEYRKSKTVANPDYKNNKTLKVNNTVIYKDLKRLTTYLIAVLRKQRKASKSEINYKNFPFIANPYGSYLFFLRNIIRERYLLSRRNIHFNHITPGDKFIYFPLHLIPESSTSIKAPFLQNEEEIIALVSKVLPIGYKLYLKEHGAMIGERPIAFYRKISRLSNVMFIKLDMFNDPKDWIKASEGVITISGTSAFEAVMLGKRAMVFGSVPFSNVEGIIKANHSSIVSDISNLISDLNDNIDSCAKYLKFIDDVGEAVEFTRLHNLAYFRLLASKDIDDIRGEFEVFNRFFRKAMTLTER